MTLRGMRKNKKLIVCVAITTLPIIFVLALFFRGVRDRNEYKQFLLDFDRSISFASQRDLLRAEFYGNSTRLTVENANTVYRMILDGGYYYYDEEIPKSEKVFLLDFGTGEKIWFYPEDNKPLTCFIVRYISLDEEEYTYMTSVEYRFADLEKLASVEFGNELWEE